MPMRQIAAGQAGDALGTLQQELAAGHAGRASSQFSKATQPGDKQTAPDGSVWVRVMGFLLAAILLGSVTARAHAQVNLRFTPEPMAVPVSVLANARDMGRWSVIGCN